MQLVEHDAAQRAEQERRVRRGEDQRELLRRREQDVRRIAALALALRRRRVAGAGLDPDRQLHLGDRRLEVARDVDRERLQRRDVERVQPALAPHARGRWRSSAACVALGARHASRSAPPASAEIPPASCRRRSARSAAPSGRRAPSPAVRADARAASQPRCANQRANGSGSVDGFGAFENGHALEVVAEDGAVEAGFAATTTSPGTGMLFSVARRAAVEADTSRARHPPARRGHDPRRGRSAASRAAARRRRHAFPR